MRLSLDNFRASAANTLLSKEQQRHTRGGEATYDVDYGIICFYEVFGDDGISIFNSGDGYCAGTHSECMAYVQAAGRNMASALGGGRVSAGCNYG